MAISKPTAPEFPELSFEEEKHIYRLNGKTFLPSVSMIMKPLRDAVYSGIDEAVLKAAAEKGKCVHNAIENYLLFKQIDIPPEHEGYFDGFVRWFESYRPQVIATENRVYHRLIMYAGTSDILCMIDGGLWVIDTKTTAQINSMLTGVQLEGYAKCYESHGIRIAGKAILHLTPESKYTFTPYPANDRESWEVFGALATVYRHIQKYKFRR